MHRHKEPLHACRSTYAPLPRSTLQRPGSAPDIDYSGSTKPVAHGTSAQRVSDAFSRNTWTHKQVDRSLRATVSFFVRHTPRPNDPIAVYHPPPAVSISPLRVAKTVGRFP